MPDNIVDLFHKKTMHKHITFSLFFSFAGLFLLIGCDAAKPKKSNGDETGQTESGQTDFGPSGPTLSVEAQEAENIARYENLEIPFIEIRHSSGVHSVNFSRDGKKIVTAARNAHIFDADTGTELHKLEGHAVRVNSAVFSPDGRKVATVSGNIWTNAPNDDRSVCIWDANTGKELRKLVVPTSSGAGSGQLAIYSAVFSPDSRKLLTVSSEGIARIWDAESGAELRKIGEPGSNPKRVNYAVYSRDGKRILTGCGAFISGDRSPISGTEPGSVIIWDAESGKELQRMEGHTRKVEFVAFSQDEKRIVSVSTGDDVRISINAEQTVRIWDAASGKELQKLKARVLGSNDTDLALLVAFSPDARRMLTRDTTWDVVSGKELHTWQATGGGEGNVRSALFSPDGKVILTAHGDCARIRDSGTGVELKKLGGRGLPGMGGDSHQARFAAFSSDGKKFVTAESSGSSGTNRIRIWTLE